MRISTKGRYALRVMIDLAEHDDGKTFIPLRDISERQGVTVKYLEQIIPPLSRAGYVHSLRGNTGGYRLARPVRSVTVGDILRTMEGSLAPVACLEDEINQCPRCDRCLTLKFWRGLDDVINEYVDGYTLGDLLDGEAKHI
jgi:Rrf2 family protein